MHKAALKYSAILLLMFGGLFADFYSKNWAESNLRGRQPYSLVKHFVDLGFAENRGMVFGLFNGSMSGFASGFMIVIRVLIFVALSVFIWIKRKKNYLYLLPFLLFWIGAIGNLIDMVSKGYVVDFIHIHAGSILNWPFYFNLADAYVTVGMVLIAGYELSRSIRQVVGSGPVEKSGI